MRMPNYLIDSDLDGKSCQLYLNFAPLIHCPCGSALTGSQLRESLGHGFCLGWDEAWWWWTVCPEPHEVQSICISMCIHLLVLVGNNLTDMIWSWLGLVINKTSRMLPMWFDKVSWWVGPANPGKSFVDFQGHMQLHRELLPRHEWRGPLRQLSQFVCLKFLCLSCHDFFLRGSWSGSWSLQLEPVTCQPNCWGPHLCIQAWAKSVIIFFIHIISLHLQWDWG